MILIVQRVSDGPEKVASISTAHFNRDCDLSIAKVLFALLAPVF
jgi:hypothetical protein